MSNQIENLSVEQKFLKASLFLKNFYPLYNCFYLSLRREETTITKTMGVTSTKLYYNKEFIERSEPSVVIFAIMHEILHVALRHFSRKGSRELKTYNIACDLYVNKFIVEELKITDIKKPVYMDSFEVKCLDGMVYCSSIDLNTDTVEDIYDSLIDTNNNDTEEKVYKGSKEIDDIFDEYKEVDISTIETECDIIDENKQDDILEQEENQIIKEAKTRFELSSNQANFKSVLMDKIKSNKKSYINWKSLLQRYMSNLHEYDISMSTPDSDYFYLDILVEGLGKVDSNSIKGIKVCIDTSGSISDEDLKLFNAHIKKLLKKYSVSAELIYWDSDIQYQGEFTSLKEFERVSLYGRGWTNPCVIFDYFESKKCKVKPYVTLILTDGFFDLNWVTPKLKRKYKDTIWIMTKDYNRDFKPPFGKLSLYK